MENRIELINWKDAFKHVCDDAKGTVYVVDMYNCHLEPLLLCGLSIGELKEMYENDEIALILKGE